jgi:signal transduction histidine kinase
MGKPGSEVPASAADAERPQPDSAALRRALEAEARARALAATLDNLDEGIGLIDKDLRVIAFNKRLLELLRLTPDSFKPGDPFEAIVRHLAALGEYAGEETEAAVQRRLGLARSPKPITMERLTPQGRVLEIRTNPLPDGGFVIRYNDVTEARKRAAATHQAQKMEALGQLTGGIAHDFNNPLTVVLGSAELLGEAKDPERRRALVETVIRAAERGSTLARRLLAFARRQPLEPRTVDFNRLVAGMHGMLAQTLGEQVELRVMPEPGLRAAHVDAAQLETAILNLAINARDAMPKGGRLLIETRSATIEPGAGAGEPPPGDYVVIAVSDTGVGMTDDVKARAFDPFFTTKDFGKGSGLGLSMVYGFVRQSGGYVTIYSEPGHGTIVKLYFPPAGDTTLLIEEAPGAPQIEPRGSEAVLLVEDDPMVRGHVAGMLRDLGYRVLAAENGAAGLGVLERQAVDLLFTDMVMPGGMSGRDLAEAARRLRPGIKVLFTSGYTDDHVFAASQAEDAAVFLSKPYRRRELAQKLRQVLEK